MRINVRHFGNIKKEKEGFPMFNKIALVLLIVGGLNWGLIGLFKFDLVAWLFGGQGAWLSRIVYIIVAAAALWCISLLFQPDAEAV